MEITYAKNLPIDADIAIVLVAKNQAATTLPTHWQEVYELAIDSNEFSGKLGDAYATVIETEDGMQKVIFVGLGEVSKVTLEKLKITGARTYPRIGSADEKRIGVWYDTKSIEDSAILKFIEGLLLKNYFDAQWKTGESAKDLQAKIFHTLILPANVSASLKSQLVRLIAIIDGIFLARDLVAKPPVELIPTTLADQAVEIAKRHSNMEVKVLDKAAIEKAGMGLLLAVNRGSVNEPRLIVLTLNRKATGQPIALIGKGVTFDSGGYNIKPTGHMETMHTDMAGAAAVLGTMQALAELGEKKKVVGIIPSTDNLISGNAYKPSDIITSMSGRTVEIGNTDAEGRLILADAITYAKTNFDPKAIFDLATLTGACIVALGERYAGIFSNEDKLIKNLQDASQDSGDKVWHLPLDEVFMDKMKSKIADLGNTAQGSPGAGASTGAAFLGHFAEKTPWAHIDIAGPSHQSKDLEAWNPSTGPTGFGVNLMTTLVQKYLR